MASARPSPFPRKKLGRCYLFDKVAAEQLGQVISTSDVASAKAKDASVVGTLNDHFLCRTGRVVRQALVVGRDKPAKLSLLRP